jgi:NTP pyrophosphatase (non-canonical NTP hydrolase)
VNDHVSAFIAAEDTRLRAAFGNKAAGNEWHLTHVIKIMEELGELAEQVLARQSLRRPNQSGVFNEDTLGDEIADVHITTLLVARDLKVNVNDALNQKNRKD